jgi:hypothetical protein
VKNRQHKASAYGFCVAYKLPTEKKWVIDGEQDGMRLPAFYELQEEAADRVLYLREHDIPARLLTLLAEEGKDNWVPGKGKPQRPQL